MKRDLHEVTRRLKDMRVWMLQSHKERIDIQEFKSLLEEWIPDVNFHSGMFAVAARIGLFRKTREGRKFYWSITEGTITEITISKLFRDCTAYQTGKLKKPKHVDGTQKYKEMLESLGYRVFSNKNALDEAIKIIQEAGLVVMQPVQTTEYVPFKKQ